MKKLQILLALVMATPIIAISPMAIAENNSSTSSGTVDTTKTTTTDPEKDIEKLIEAEKAKVTQADRIKLHVDLLKIKLTAAESVKLKTKCVGAQGLVKVLDTKINSDISVRSKAYDELLSHVDGLIVKLKAAKITTTDLESERAVLKTKTETFKTDLVKYKVALSDVESVGCIVDPASFKATLEAARTVRKTVADDALAVRTYVTGTIKPTIKTIRDNLGKPATSTDKATTSTGGTQ